MYRNHLGFAASSSSHATASISSLPYQVEKCSGAITRSLSTSSPLSLSSEEQPPGPHSSPVDGAPSFLSTVVVYLQVQGLVYLDAEVAKCDEKVDLVRINLDKLYDVVSQPDYQTIVPEAVQFGNEEKRKTLEVELSALLESREIFTKLQ